jgi:hypothetical protein
MTRTNLAYFDGSYGHLTVVDDYETYEITTLPARENHYIRIDDRKQYPQLCRGGGRTGNTLSWSPETETLAYHFARDCNARLYKTRAGYDRARDAAMESNP